MVIDILSITKKTILEQSKNIAVELLNSEECKSVKDIWTVQVLSQLLDGQVIIPDSVVNENLTSRIPQDEVTKLNISALENDLIGVEFLTKKHGKVNLQGQLLEFRHDEEKSILKARVVKLTNDTFFGKYVFSLLGVSLYAKIFGNLDLGEGITAQVDGNEITVDFRERLYNSKAAGIKIRDKTILDIVKIKKAATEPGKFILSVDLAVTPNIKRLFESVEGAIDVKQ